jgi:hypothetical protein
LKVLELGYGQDKGVYPELSRILFKVNPFEVRYPEASLISARVVGL